MPSGTVLPGAARPGQNPPPRRGLHLLIDLPVDLVLKELHVLFLLLHEKKEHLPDRRLLGRPGEFRVVPDRRLLALQRHPHHVNGIRCLHAFLRNGGLPRGVLAVLSGAPRSLRGGSFPRIPGRTGDTAYGRPRLFSRPDDRRRWRALPPSSRRRAPSAARRALRLPPPPPLPPRRG